jgi:hypothetical protein
MLLTERGINMKTIKSSTRAIKAPKEAIEVKEKFMPVDTRLLDSKHRITLGGRLYRVVSSKMKIDSYQVFVGKDGDILLRPAVSIPSSEAWVYRNPGVIGKVRQGLKEAAAGKTEKVDNLEDFLNAL